MNLHTTSFFNSTEVSISSRMNEYLKKNFGYEVEGDFDTLQEARKSLQAEQLELKDNYMSAKYVENMLMIETITSLLKAHGEEPSSEESLEEATNKVSMAKLKTGDIVTLLAKGPGAVRNGFKRGENPFGEGNEIKILGFGVVPYKEKADKRHVLANSLADFKSKYKKEIRDLKSDDDYERGLQMKFNSRARLSTIVNDIVDQPGFVGYIIEPLGDAKKIDLLYISLSMSDDKWVIGYTVDEMEFDLVSGGASQSESLEEDEEKGPDHYKWKNDSQLAVALGRIESAMEALDYAIQYRSENSDKFLRGFEERAGVGDLMRIKEKLVDIHSNWEKETEYYGM